MNKKTEEALRMAIEHIENNGTTTERKIVINACKAALEQPSTKDWIGTALERADKDEAFRNGLIGEIAKPLSDDEIRNCLYGECKTQDFLQFARAIEKAHGIGND